MKKKTTVFRFFNIDKGLYGEIFAMCKLHEKAYRPPKTLIMEKVGENSDIKCDDC